MNNNFWKNRKILPTITTINKSRWPKKIEEIEKLRLREVFLFLTPLEIKERRKVYELLNKTKIEKIPFVHIRSDMELWELDYLIERYQTEIFNIHSMRQYPLLYNYDKYKHMIYIENSTVFPLQEKEIKDFAGICLDLSHLENTRLMDQNAYQYNVNLLEKYPIGCNHISAIKKSPFSKKESPRLRHDCHDLEDLSELDYVKRYPVNYFSSFIAIELENSIKEQLEAKDYIIDLLKDK